MRVIKQPISTYLQEAKEVLEKDPNKARDLADKAMIHIVRKKERNIKDNDIVEGTPLRIWYDRVWQFLENNNLML